MADNGSQKMTLAERISARERIEVMRAIVKTPEDVEFLDDLEAKMQGMTYHSVEDEISLLMDRLAETMPSEEFMSRFFNRAVSALERGWRATMRGEEQPTLRLHQDDGENKSEHSDRHPDR